MTVTINQTQLNELKAIAEKSGDNRVEYYNKLISFGDKYAELAKGVVTNTGFSGRIANAYMADQAAEAGKPFTASENLVFSKDLMARDFKLRSDAFYNKDLGGNIELGYEVIKAYHEASLKLKLDLPATAWTAYAPLQAAKTLAEKQAIWDMMINKDGGTSLKEYTSIFFYTARDAIDPSSSTAKQSANFLSEFFLKDDVKQNFPELYKLASTYLPATPVSIALGFLPSSTAFKGLSGLIGGGHITSEDILKYRFGIIDLENSTNGTAVDSFKETPCFSALTPILTPNGEILIENIQAGDSVLAFDGFGELTACRVVNLQRNTTDRWIALNYGDVSIKATPNHRMFTPSGEFATLESLMQGKTEGVLALVACNDNASRNSPQLCLVA